MLIQVFAFISLPFLCSSANIRVKVNADKVLSEDSCLRCLKYLDYYQLYSEQPEESHSKNKSERTIAYDVMIPDQLLVLTGVFCKDCKVTSAGLYSSDTNVSDEQNGIKRSIIEARKEGIRPQCLMLKVDDNFARKRACVAECALYGSMKEFFITLHDGSPWVIAYLFPNIVDQDGNGVRLKSCKAFENLKLISMTICLNFDNLVYERNVLYGDNRSAFDLLKTPSSTSCEPFLASQSSHLLSHSDEFQKHFRTFQILNPYEKRKALNDCLNYGGIIYYHSWNHNEAIISVYFSDADDGAQGINLSCFYQEYKKAETMTKRKVLSVVYGPSRQMFGAFSVAKSRCYLTTDPILHLCPSNAVEHSKALKLNLIHSTTMNSDRSSYIEFRMRCNVLESLPPEMCGIKVNDSLTTYMDNYSSFEPSEKSHNLTLQRFSIDNRSDYEARRLCLECFAMWYRIFFISIQYEYFWADMNEVLKRKTCEAVCHNVLVIEQRKIVIQTPSVRSLDRVMWKSLLPHEAMKVLVTTILKREPKEKTLVKEASQIHLKELIRSKPTARSKSKKNGKKGTKSKGGNARKQNHRYKTNSSGNIDQDGESQSLDEEMDEQRIEEDLEDQLEGENEAKIEDIEPSQAEASENINEHQSDTSSQKHEFKNAISHSHLGRKGADAPSSCDITAVEDNPILSESSDQGADAKDGCNVSTVGGKPVQRSPRNQGIDSAIRHNRRSSNVTDIPKQSAACRHVTGIPSDTIDQSVCMKNMTDSFEHSRSSEVTEQSDNNDTRFSVSRDQPMQPISRDNISRNVWTSTSTGSRDDSKQYRSAKKGLDTDLRPSVKDEMNDVTENLSDNGAGAAVSMNNRTITGRDSSDTHKHDSKNAKATKIHMGRTSNSNGEFETSKSTESIAGAAASMNNRTIMDRESSDTHKQDSKIAKATKIHTDRTSNSKEQPELTDPRAINVRSPRHINSITTDNEDESMQLNSSEKYTHVKSDTSSGFKDIGGALRPTNKKDTTFEQLSEQSLTATRNKHGLHNGPGRTDIASGESYPMKPTEKMIQAGNHRRSDLKANATPFFPPAPSKTRATSHKFLWPSEYFAPFHDKAWSAELKPSSFEPFIREYITNSKTTRRNQLHNSMTLR